MQSDSMFDLSSLVVESINVMPVESAERLTEGHAMTELAGSQSTTVCGCSTPSFVLEDEFENEI